MISEKVAEFDKGIKFLCSFSYLYRVDHRIFCFISNLGFQILFFRSRNSSLLGFITTKCGNTPWRVCFRKKGAELVTLCWATDSSAVEILCGFS